MIVADYADLLGREERILPLTKQRVFHSALVTGAGGSIGSAIVRALVSIEGHRVIAADRSEAALAAIPSIDDVLPCLTDVAHFDKLAFAFDRYGPKFVFHCAAHKHVPMLEHEVMEAVENNIQGTANVARLCRSHGCQLVVVSTDKAARPRSVMGMTKALAEKAAVSLCPNTRIVRFGNVLGSSGSVIEIWQRQKDAGESLSVTDPNMRRFFITIDEAVGLCLAVVDQEPGTYTLDMGAPIPIPELARRFAPDYPQVETAIRPGERLFDPICSEHERLVATGVPYLMRIENGV